MLKMRCWSSPSRASKCFETKQHISFRSRCPMIAPGFEPSESWKWCGWYYWHRQIDINWFLLHTFSIKRFYKWRLILILVEVRILGHFFNYATKSGLFKCNRGQPVQSLKRLMYLLKVASCCIDFGILVEWSRMKLRKQLTDSCDTWRDGQILCEKTEMFVEELNCNPIGCKWQMWVIGS